MKFNMLVVAVMLYVMAEYTAPHQYNGKVLCMCMMAAAGIVTSSLHFSCKQKPSGH